MRGSLPHPVLKYANFLNTDISQGSVATHLRFVGVFNSDFIANLLLSLPVKNFANRSERDEITGKSIVDCFLTHSVYTSLWLLDGVVAGFLLAYVACRTDTTLPCHQHVN